MPNLRKNLKRFYYILRRLNPTVSRRYLYIGKGNFIDLKKLKIVKITPNLFIIGAEKSGTTSLYKYLDQHPDIFMSKPNKEPQYLMPDKLMKKYFHATNFPLRNQNDVLKNHMLRGYRGEKYFGDATTSYTRGNVARGYNIPQKIRNVSKKAKIIYVVRNPYSRIASSNAHRLRRRVTRLSLNDAVLKEGVLIKTTKYAWQIETYVNTLGRNNVLLFTLEELAEDPQKTLRDTISFLGLPQIEFDVSEKFNVDKNKSLRDNTYSLEAFSLIQKELSKDLNTLTNKYNVKTKLWDMSHESWVDDSIAS